MLGAGRGELARWRAVFVACFPRKVGAVPAAETACPSGAGRAALKRDIMESAVSRNSLRVAPPGRARGWALVRCAPAAGRAGSGVAARWRGRGFAPSLTARCQRCRGACIPKAGGWTARGWAEPGRAAFTGSDCGPAGPPAPALPQCAVAARAQNSTTNAGSGWVGRGRTSGHSWAQPGGGPLSPRPTEGSAGSARRQTRDMRNWHAARRG